MLHPSKIMRMRCFLATALTAFFSFAWSGAEAATATGTFNVQVTIAPTRKISRAFGVLLLPAWFAASGAAAASLQVAPVLLEVVAPGAAATVTLRNNGAKPIATQVRVFRWIQQAGGSGWSRQRMSSRAPRRSSCNRRRTMSPASFASRKNRSRARRPTVCSSTNYPRRHKASAQSLWWCATRSRFFSMRRAVPRPKPHGA